MFGSKSRKIKNLENEIAQQTALIKTLRYENKEAIINNEILVSENEKLKVDNKKLIATIKEKDKHYKSFQNNLVSRFNTAKSQLNTDITTQAQYLAEDIVKEKISSLDKHYKTRIADLEAKEELVKIALDNIKFHPELTEQFQKIYDRNDYFNSIKNNLLRHTFDNPPKIEELGICAFIKSSANDNIKYFTTPASCTCKDHLYRRRPCKHMLFLVYLLGLLQIDRNTYEQSLRFVADNVKIASEKRVEAKRYSENISKAKATHNQLIKEIALLKRRRADIDSEIEYIISKAVSEATRITDKAHSEIDKVRFNKKGNQKIKKSPLP